LSGALGVDLPQKPKSSATRAGRTALWLGPDEWLFIDEAGKDPLADCAGVEELHSAVGISHRNVGIAVADLDATIKWYHDRLGMIVLHEEVNEEQGVREAMLSVRGAPVGSAQIQLMAPLDETSTIAKFLDKRGPGLQQLAYRVSDIDALTERLREDGVRLLYDAPRRGTADSRINFIHPKDAGGVLIELVQPASDH
jgi:methylmalonyl-CoA/ethylmalonyl-CoA epimerase